MRWSFEDIGRDVRESVDTSTRAADAIATKSRILRASSNEARRGSPLRRRVVGVAIAASVLGAVVLAVHHPSDRSPVVFRVGEERAEGRIGAYYSADAKHRLALSFSDNSAVTLEPEASARVSHTTPTGAQVSLESGAAEVHVVHRTDTSWQIAAGPYSVRVTGTSFRIEWQPQTRTVDIAMHQGAVRVTGPGIDNDVVVQGSAHFTTRESAPITPTPSVTAEPAQPAPATSVESVPAPSASSGSAHAEIDSSAPAYWSALAAKGRYADIVHAAEHRGLDSVLADSDRSALASLADAARFTGRSDLARRALQTVRERFAGSPAAADAAFVLGRMDDEAGAVSSGFAWYDRYLSEAPSGHFAAEALGRKMLALRKLGDSPGSASVAREYLDRFPDGPYASVARQLSAP